MVSMSSKEIPQGNKDRFGRLLRERRTQLGLSQVEIADLNGPSPDTVNKFEQGIIGKRLQNRTLAGLDTALRWEPGSSKRALLEGTTPIATDHPHEFATARKIKTAIDETVGMNADMWAPIPRHHIKNIATAAHKLVSMCRLNPEVPEDVCAIGNRIHLMAADMLTIALASERGDDELLILLDAIGNEEQDDGDIRGARRVDSQVGE